MFPKILYKCNVGILLVCLVYTRMFQTQNSFIQRQHFVVVIVFEFICFNEIYVCETRTPPAATKSKYGKIFRHTFWPRPTPRCIHVMSLKCEQPLDEITVQYWSLHRRLNFQYCTIFINWTELVLRADKWTDADSRCFRRTSRTGHKII